MIDIATYVVSDIHGEYELFIRLLEEICLKETDTGSWRIGKLLSGKRHRRIFHKRINLGQG